MVLIFPKLSVYHLYTSNLLKINEEELTFAKNTVINGSNFLVCNTSHIFQEIVFTLK